MTDYDPDDWDHHWEQQASVASANPAQTFRHRLVANLSRQHEPQNLIDIGCGQGDFLQYLDQNQNNLKLYGVELSRAGVEITKRKVPKAQVIQANLLTVDDTSEIPQCEIGTCIEVLEHINEPEIFLERAVQFLKPGGKLIVTVPSGPRTAFDKHIGHRRHFNSKSLTKLLEDAGMEEIEIRRYGWPFFNLYRVMVYVRGKKLIEDVESQLINDSLLARILQNIFSILFKFNLPARFVGWQLVGISKRPNS